MALECQTEGKRTAGQRKTTQRKKWKQVGWASWDDARDVAQSRAGWSARVVALCTSLRNKHDRGRERTNRRRNKGKKEEGKNELISIKLINILFAIDLRTFDSVNIS